MEQRPEYVPRLWIWWGLNRWMAADPRRVLAWFIVMPPLGVVGSLLMLLAGSVFGWIAGAATVVLVGQAVVYAPRAYRAMSAPRPALKS